MERFKNKFYIGIVLTVLAVAAEIALVVILNNSKLLPGKIILWVIGGLAVFTLVGALLALLTEKLWIPGNVLLALLLVFGIVVSVLAFMGINTLQNDVFVTLPVEEDIMCIFVNKEDKAKKLEDLEGYTIGVLADVDTAESEGLLLLLEEQHNLTCAVKSYVDFNEMLEALFDRTQIQAAIFNPVYLEILSDMREEDLEEYLHPLFYMTISTLPEVTDPSTEETTEETTGESVPADIKLKPFAVYITGIDGRNVSVKYKANSDVNIIVAVNPDTKQVLLLSTPRDSYIQMPIDGVMQPDKLTHAGCYGLEQSLGVMENLYGIEIDYYFKVNFSGFKNIINALGGVTVYSNYSFKLASQGTVVKGYNYMDGAKALEFVRDRNNVPGGDQTRGKHQMAVINAVMEKAMSPALLLNYTSVLKSVEGCFATSVPYELMAALVRNLFEEGADWEILNYAVTGKNARRWLYSLSIWVPGYAVNDTILLDENELAKGKELLTRLLSGERISLS